jgi:hypothetical protein
MLDLKNAARDNLRLSPAELSLVKLFLSLRRKFYRVVVGVVKVIFFRDCFLPCDKIQHHLFWVRRIPHDPAQLASYFVRAGAFVFYELISEFVFNCTSFVI